MASNEDQRDTLSGDKVTDAAAPVVSGTDIRIIQALLGHTRIDTTARYAAVSPNAIANVVSPLDQLGASPKSNPKSKTHR